ncbi:sulfatase-like hydrolase/transferase [Achromobacter anxifer]|uniref:Arylsulfatase n=1 Tax=Achromobacter anxifer TaxID=1287737 RepID=A0A6S7CRC4_9BURK|nr:sulfatase-like hydrolase/transferase [Achromobacter anxifer]MDF8365872.1 sulfatase-like hydrolase/transferase [Achromobacter anxifer]CAB3859273.1 Arylsulfatase [Achromobacter anxifer]
MKRPNILLITTDQHRGDCLGFAGRRVKTPHIDHLARTGTHFTACITPNVVCQPSRASMLTGLLPLTHGVRDNGIDLDLRAGEAGFAGSLAAAGYDTGFIGKAHFSTHHTFQATGRPECQYSEAGMGPAWAGPYMGFEHVELVVEGHNYWLPTPLPGGLNHSRWHYGDGLGELRNQLYQTDLGPASGAPQTFNSALPAAWHNSAWIGDRSVDYLREHRDRPFCLWASFPDPHHPFDCPEPWSRLHHPDEVDLPRHRVTDYERRPWWHRASMESKPMGNAEVQAVRQNFSRMPTQSDEALRRIIANYYGMISLVDHQVGRIMKALSEYGLDQDTIVIFTSDHGEWLGDHGLMLKGPMPYEGLLRVAMVASGPGIVAGQRVEDPVSTLDLAATFYDYGGASGLAPVHGRSLRPLLEGRDASREFALSEWDVAASRCGVELKLRTVRTRDWKLTLELGSGAGEMYCLADDPDEMDNLFDDPGHAAKRRELTDMLASRPADQLSARVAASGIA